MDLFTYMMAKNSSGSSGGSSGAADQNFNPKSQNAQSGIAVAQAIEKVDQTSKLLNFPIDSIYSASVETNAFSSDQQSYYVRLKYLIKLENIDGVTETGDVIITPLRTNIPKIETSYYNGYFERTILGEVVNINWTIDESLLDPEVSGTSDFYEVDLKSLIEGAGVTYERKVYIDSSTSSFNMLIITAQASSPDKEIISALNDELFSKFKLAQTNIILEYKKQPVLEELISEVIE